MAHSSAKKLKGSQRTTGKVHPPRTVIRTRKRAACHVCSKILFLLKCSFTSYTEIDLGTPDNVLDLSGCPYHPTLIREVLDLDSVSQSIFALFAVKFPSTSGVRFLAKGTGGGLIHHSDYLNILTDSSHLHVGVRARIVAPRWIDAGVLRRWTSTCDRHHGACCTANSSKLSITASPSWLIDCWRQRVVPASPDQQYVALSYVWGKVPAFKTLKSNLEQLRRDNSLLDPTVSPYIPQTIKDVMVLTNILHERYVWVDSLCIVQDDECTKQRNLIHMGAIFSKASLTVIATSGNANHGLRGLPGASHTRDFHQISYKLNRSTELIPRRRDRQSAILSNLNVWKTRAWTFQEALFSRRCIFFHDDTVSWGCGHVRWYEEETELQEDKSIGYAPIDVRRVLSVQIPDLPWLGSLIRDFNSRDLTHPEDAHDAFAGVLAFLCQYFQDGFLFGVPVCCFDIALLWQPLSKVSPRGFRTAGSGLFPSWSWLAWEGQLLPWPSCVKNVVTRFIRSSRPVAPTDSVDRLVQWHYQKTKTSAKIEIKSEWHIYRQRFANNATLAPPIGWTRHEGTCEENPSSPVGCAQASKIRRRYFYKHERAPEHEFAYPVPLCDNKDQIFVSTEFPLISCRTRRAWLYAGERLDGSAPTVSLRTTERLWAGALQLHEDLLDTHAETIEGRKASEQPFELAEIARSHIPEVDLYREDQLIEWTHDERPKRGSRYEFYDVLWVEWRDETAYRKGLGRVERKMWEAQEREWFDLILG